VMDVGLEDAVKTVLPALRKIFVDEGLK
jgi:hypothetical protein